MDTDRRPTDPLVAAVLAAAAAPAEAPMPGETAALARFRDEHRRRGGFWPMRRSLVVGAFFGFALAAGGAAGAATGTIPVFDPHSHGQVTQQPAGHDTPDADEITGERAARAHSDPATGNPIAEIAHGDSTGVEKGSAVCTAASDSQCEAGEHGKATTHSPAAAAHNNQHPTTKVDGASTAGVRSDGRSTAGIAHRPAQP